MQLVATDDVVGEYLHFKKKLVFCSCVATAYNNTHVNYSPKNFKVFY
jgi:hypothetical protein